MRVFLCPTFLICQISVIMVEYLEKWLIFALIEKGFLNSTKWKLLSLCWDLSKKEIITIPLAALCFLKPLEMHDIIWSIGRKAIWLTCSRAIVHYKQRQLHSDRLIPPDDGRSRPRTRMTQLLVGYFFTKYLLRPDDIRLGFCCFSY